MLLPIYVARFVGSNAWGSFNTAQSFTLIAISLGYWGFLQYLPREIVRNQEGIEDYLSSALQIVAAVSIVITLLSLIIVRLLNYPPELERLIQIGLLTTVLLGAETIVCESVISALERMEWIAAVRLPATLLRTGIGVWLLANGYGIEVLFLLLGGYYLVAIIAYLLLLLRSGVRLMWGAGRQSMLTLARGAIPFVLIVAAGESFKQIDRIFISKLRNVDEVAIYATGVLLIQVVQMVAPNVMTALFPGLSRAYTQSAERFTEITQHLFKWLLLAMFPLVLTLIALTPFLIVLIFSDRYTASIPIMQLAALSLLPVLATRLLFRVILASNNEQMALPVAIARSVATVLLNLLLIPTLGIVGSAVALIATELVGLILNYSFVTTRILPLPFKTLLLLPLMAMLAGGAIYLLLLPFSTITAYVAAMFVFVGLVFGTKTLDSADWAFLRNRT